MQARLARISSHVFSGKKLQTALFITLTVLLSGLSGITLTPAAAQANQVTGLCTATIDQLNGQGRFSLNGLSRFSLNGLEGANAELDSTDGIPQELIDQVLKNTIDSTWIQQYIDGWTSGNKPSVASERTAILIVDDFGSGLIDTSTLPAAQREEWNEQHEAVYGAPLPDFVDQVAHGDLVAEVARNLVTALRHSGDSELFDLANNLWVVEVDISDAAGYQLSLVADEIRSEISYLQTNYGINRFVINMSFGLVPCEVQNLGSRAVNFNFERYQGQRNETPRFVFDVDFEFDTGEPAPAAYNGYSITDFFMDGYGGTGSNPDRAARLPEDEALKAIGELLSYPSTDVGGGEPEMLQLRSMLSAYLQASANGSMYVIPIAASGNYADVIPDAPLAPAKYPEVISAGATLGMEPTSPEWFFSQPGHLVAPGAWYNFFADGSYSAGTSFSAPYASVLASMYLAFPEVCKFENARPPLKNFNYIETTLSYGNMPFNCSYDDLIGDFEMINNGGFENRNPDGSNDLLPWTAKLNAKDKIRCNKPNKPATAYGDRCAYSFKGGPGENSKLIQTASNPQVVFNKGGNLDLSFYGGGSSPAADLRAKLIVKYTDGTNKGKIDIRFSQTSAYQYFDGSYKLESSAVDKIKLKIINKGWSGKVFIDDVSVKYTPDPSTMTLGLPGDQSGAPVDPLPLP